MNRKILIGLLAATALCGCSKNEAVEQSTEAQTEAVEETIKPITYSDLELYRTLTKESNEFVISPFLVKDSYTKLYHNADGSVKSDIAEAFNLNEETLDKLKRTKDSLTNTKRITFVNDVLKNSQKVSELGEVIPDEEDSLADNADEITTETDTGIKLLSYADDMTSTYQDELSDETEYKVSFSLPSDFFMYKNKINIVNLMSFDLRFNYGIHTTMDENNEHAYTAMYGYETPENLKELSQDKISVLRLPYAKTDEDADQYAMYIIADSIPTENSKVDSFVSSLTKEAFDELLNFNENAGPNCSEVSFDVPVVSQTSEFVISGNMDELGLVSPFDDGITGLDGQRLNEIYNATEFTMDVDDSGDGVEEKVSEDQAVIIQNFNVAGPYVYVVKDENTNEIILMGKCLNN